MFTRRRTAPAGVAATAPGPERADGADALPVAAAAGPQDGQPGGVQAAAEPARKPSITPGKGRPTRKRSEAESRRRQPISAPRDRKAYRAREREARVRRMEAMRRGEEWALPPRDRGPAKALARDYVDSRRRISEFYMYGLLVLMVLLFINVPAVQTIVPLLVMVAVLVMVAEGIFIGRQVRTLVEQRLPGESTRGIRLYAAMRALQIRRLRVPKPRIRPGDSF